MARAIADKQIAGNKVRTEKNKKLYINKKSVRHEMEYNKNHADNKKGI